MRNWLFLARRFSKSKNPEFLGEIEAFQKRFEKQEGWKPLVQTDFQKELGRLYNPHLDFNALSQQLIIPFQDLIERKSKKVRPQLIASACSLLGIQDQGIIDTCSAYVELLHSNLLILDDIMDKSQTRRGKPAIHLLYGTDTALTTSGFMHHKTTRNLVAQLQLTKPEQIAAVYDLIFEYLEKIYIGLAWDIKWHQKKDLQSVPTMQNYVLMCLLKTSKVMNLGIDLIAKLKPVDLSKLHAVLTAYEDFGIAFQINDDLINLYSNDYATLKGLDDDLIEAKMSFPIIHYCQEHKTEPQLVERLLDLLNVERKDGRVLDEIKGIIRTKKCFEEGMTTYKQHMDRCFTVLETAFPEQTASVQKIKNLAKFLVKEPAELSTPAKSPK